MDRMVTAFADKYSECNVVYLGAGLETAYDRLYEREPDSSDLSNENAAVNPDFL